MVLGTLFGCELSRGETQGLRPARWQSSHTAHVEMLVSCCFQRASGSPPSGAVSSGTSKASRNGERNSGLAKRNGMRRKSRSGGWRGAPSSRTIGPQGWCWAAAGLHPQQGCGATEAVDNLRCLAWGLPRCLVCVLWVLATGRVRSGGCRVSVVGHHGVSVSSKANPTALGLSVAVFCSSWSSLLTLQCLY